ncbi:N-acetyltransferase 9-like protein [Tribolium castaneum]|uniref:N-acetyltransferase 9-like protein n=1 Tax=Tribolium castaneum TaxID=7070 RepID=D6WDB7_TRICA|nr:PREDICTED: N-acetyltransferase 9-like protein [Tribolium castaneum]EEZ99544.1 N-acetyltransferase 9-like protein [Tribolium castaneum]|eukprot:XP_971056.1 PREDICTED: N-acetyltransferase 9-like protein [Tribolium castaneum]
MLINKNTQIIGCRTILVPYKAEHVSKYHSWMQSEELQKLTASEPLTLEEEYDMQKSWMMDEDKCTFIILDKEKYNSCGNEIESMIGDTNLFFANADDRICAEAEIMIAEQWARGRKCGSEAMLLMFLYGIETLGVKEFVVKISDDNDVSIHMFKSCGFIETGRSEIFKEITFSKIVDETWIAWLKSTVGDYEVVENKT